MKRVCFLTILYIFTCNLYAGDKLSLKTVVIDAGHGGKDPGAVGKIIFEKDVALKVALKLGAAISANFPDVKVVYTRSTDVFIALDERANIANRNKADLFISIHANMISNPLTKGTETFVLGLHRTEDNLEVAKKENSVIVMEDDYTTKYEGFDPNLSESYIIFELIQNAYLDQSIAIASSVEKELNTFGKRNDRGVKQAGFLVLRQTSMPSILIETGFLSNREEEKYLASDAGQDEISKSILRAFNAYKSTFEAKSNIQKKSEEIVDNGSKSTSSVGPEKDNSVVFKIQIASSEKKLKNSDFPLSKFDEIGYYKDGNKYKYTAGSSNNPEYIQKSLQKAKLTIKDAFIVGFDRDGKRLSNSQVKKLLQKK